MDHREKRLEYWNHFIEQFFVEKFGGAAIITGPRLRRIKEAILVDGVFWFDIIDRHDGQNRTPERMKADSAENYEHCLGNFWGMLAAKIERHEEFRW